MESLQCDAEDAFSNPDVCVRIGEWRTGTLLKKSTERTWFIIRVNELMNTSEFVCVCVTHLSSDQRYD
jgi:hypothetical protein